MSALTYPGKPCIHGHGTRRYVSTGRCVECERLREQKRYLVRYVPKTRIRRGRLSWYGGGTKHDKEMSAAIDAMLGDGK